MYTIITEPGKFEGELSIVPKMWDLVLEGLSADVYFEDITYSFVSLIAVEEPTSEYYGACLWEDQQGFVHTQWYRTKQQYMESLRELEKKSAEYSE